MNFRACLLVICLFTCCTALAQDVSCNEKEIGKIYFKRNSSKLTIKSKKILDTIVSYLLREKTCQIVATSYSADLCDRCGVLSWDRLQAIFSYLAKKGIAKERLVGNSLLDGNFNFVNLRLSQTLDKKINHPNVKMDTL